MPHCFAWLLLLATGANQPVAGQALVYLGCEPAENSPWAAAPAEAQIRGFQSGQLLEQSASQNRGCWHFDGQRTLVHCRLPASLWTGAFTWEGFFLSPRDNRVTIDQAISDRFLTQFADAGSQRTRLAVGLSVTRDGQLPRLSVALTGYSRRLGMLEVRPDVWHHFAVTYQPYGQTASYGTLAWYLDYRLCGHFTVDGLSPQSTLLPPSQALLAIGGRNAAGGKVDRGFEGFLDELRMTARALAPAEFLHVRRRTVSRPVTAEFYGPLKPDFSWTALPAPVETQAQEALALAGFPPAYSFSAVSMTRRGWHAARTSRRMILPEGNYTIRLQTRSAAILAIDGKVLLDGRTSAGSSAEAKGEYGARLVSGAFHADGRAHDYVITAAVDFGTGKIEAAAADNQVDVAQRPRSRLGDDEVIVTYSRLDSKGEPGQWQLLGSDQTLMVAPYWWLAYRGRMLEAWQEQEPERRAKAARRRDEFWARRHAWAAKIAEKLPVAEPPTGEHPIDFFLGRRLAQCGISPAPLADDATFLRRVTLDLAGRVPTFAEAQAFFAETGPNKRSRLIDRLLASSEWGDAWVGYWQDLLAENPSILKPTLNNSGPFRFWIHRSLASNKPLDQFAAELLLMEGSDELGGTAGFAQASGNDLPMAMKAHIIGKAFLGIDMKCARCHDAPNVAVEQADLFALAAMLEERPIAVPAQSVVVSTAAGRKPAVKSSLAAGDRVQPAWPLEKILPAESGDDNGYRLGDWINRPRAELASIVISPHQTRFADVMVNRLWQGFMGAGLVEPLDHWFEREAASHPDLLAWLSRELVKSGYDAKHIARLIVTSTAYQRRVQPEASSEAHGRTFAGQMRRRLSAEQLVDSIYLIAGKAFAAEELNFDPHGSQGFLKLPAPKRAWQCASLANERDRPALALPVNQLIVDVLSAFGWRETRPDPLTRGSIEAGPLQPLLLSNGLMVDHALRLTEDSSLLAHCLQAKSPNDLTERLFVCLLSRQPDESERETVAAVLTPGFERRLTGKPAARHVAHKAVHVDWDRHLQGANTTELLQAAYWVRQGSPATVRLSQDFRERAEDVVWALVNSPEFVLVP